MTCQANKAQRQTTNLGKCLSLPTDEFILFPLFAEFSVRERNSNQIPKHTHEHAQIRNINMNRKFAENKENES
jgi:hypothetical protein